MLRIRLARSGSSIASIRKLSSWLLAPAARLAWKARSLSWRATGSSAASRIAASASSMAETAARPAWAAASEAICTSSARRTSSRSSSWRGSRRTAAVNQPPIGAALGRATIARRPWRVSSSPRACSVLAASRTGSRLTWKVAARSASDGSSSPGSSSPSTRSSSRRTTASVMLVVASLFTGPSMREIDREGNHSSDELSLICPEEAPIWSTPDRLLVYSSDSCQAGAMKPAGPMAEARRYLAGLGLPDRDLGELPTSAKRFRDGAQYRVEIPSVEGPEPFRAVIDAAKERELRVHRISQGSGMMLLTDDDLRDMVALGQEHAIEVCLFVGPRAAWDVGVQATAPSGRVAAASLRGADQLVYGVEDVLRGCRLGVRSILVADTGQLWVLGRMKRAGDLPADLEIKISISLPVTNPATARLLEDLGATTLNLPIDLSLAQIAAIRQAVEAPLDVYVEGADDFGGAVRYYEAPDLVRVASPVHLKFTVRNAPGLYPAGEHLSALAVSSARERVRRAAIGLAMLQRHYPDAVPSA